MSESGAHWLRIAAREDPLHREAHRNALVAPRRIDEAFRQQCDRFETLLLDTLTRFEGAFVGTIRLIDELAAIPAPTRDDVKRLRAAPHNLVTLSRFFAHAGPAWLPHLHEKGYFAVSTESGESPDMVAAWSFLARIAPNAAVHIAAIVRDVAVGWPETTNPWITRYLAVVAQTLPIEDAIVLSQRLGKRLHDVRPGFARELARLALRFADEGRVSAANDVLGSLLDAGTASEGHLDAYEFEQLAKDALGDLVAAGADSALAVAMDFLERVARAPSPVTGRPDEAARGRRAIANPNRADVVEDAYSSLIDLVRRACERAAKADSSRVPVLLSMLERREPAVFRRLALHLIASFPAEAGPAVDHAIVDTTTFDSDAFAHERRFLERAAFPLLSTDARATFLAMIARGPDLSSFGDLSGFPPEMVDAHVASWKRQHYAPLVAFLPDDARADYEAIVKKLGPESGAPADNEADEDDRADAKGVAERLAEIATLSLDELLDLLRKWRPVDAALEASLSPDALGRQLSALVAAQPKAMSTAAPRFQHLRPTYV